MMVETERGASLLWIVSVAALAFCLLSLLVGAAGPQSDAYELTYAYNCFNNTHHSEGVCPGGVQLTQGQTFVAEVNRLDPLYQYVAVQVFPFMRAGSATPNQTDLLLNVTLFGKNRERLVLLWNRLVINNVQCFQEGAACTSFYLLDEPELDWPAYVLQATIPGGSSATFLGDFLFQWEATNPGGREKQTKTFQGKLKKKKKTDYSRLEVGIRLTFAFLCIGLLVWYSIQLYRIGQRAWTMEQTWMLFLLFALIWFNNPLYPLQVYTDVSFYPVLFVLFEACFMSAWILYALVYLDMIRADYNHRVDWKHPMTWLKCGAVFLYFVLTVALYMWEQVLFLNDPIVKPSSLAGPSALFYVVALCYVGLVFWIGALVVLVFPLLSRAVRNASAPPRQEQRPPPPASSPSVEGEVSASSSAASSVASDLEDSRVEEWHEVTSRGAATTAVPVQASAGAVVSSHPEALRLRLLHSIGPIVLVVLSSLASIVAGTVGPFGRTAPSFVFFHALYNTVIVYWIAGYWPVGTGTKIVRRNTSERSPLVANPFAASERQADEAAEQGEAPLFA